MAALKTHLVVLNVTFKGTIAAELTFVDLLDKQPSTTPLKIKANGEVTISAKSTKQPQYLSIAATGSAGSSVSIVYKNVAKPKQKQVLTIPKGANGFLKTRRFTVK